MSLKKYLIGEIYLQETTPEQILFPWMCDSRPAPAQPSEPLLKYKIIDGELTAKEIEKIAETDYELISVVGHNDTKRHYFQKKEHHTCYCFDGLGGGLG